MAENTKIEWATHTFNAWAGCEKVSRGCKNCYAERDTRAYGYLKGWGAGTPRRRTSAAYWRKPLRWNKDQEIAEARARDAGEPLPMRPRVFAQSWSDTWEDRRDLDGLRDDLHALIQATPYLIWLMLTKRSEEQAAYYLRHGVPGNVLPGITGEDQATLDARSPHITSLGVPWFLSAEPMVGPLTVTRPCDSCTERGLAGPLRALEEPETDCDDVLPGLVWVIPGGESGLGRGIQPMPSRWPRLLRDECQFHGIAFLMKQWGEFMDDGCPNHAELGDPYGYINTTTGNRVVNPDRALHGDEVVPVWRVGKEAAGRRLDGRTWDELPAIFSHSENGSCGRA